MKTRILVLGAGFGGLELTTLLSDAVGDSLDLTLIDKSDAFVFGFSKLDAMFGRLTPDQIRIPYKSIVKPGVHFVQDSITAIDPVAKRVTTSSRVYEADIVVVALGADYDLSATPGLSEAGNEFYSVSGALRVRELLPNFEKGHVIVGVISAPYKCPPAPSEMVLMLHDYLTQRGVRDACKISLLVPFGVPIPPSPESSKALMEAFVERNINFIPKTGVQSLDPARKVALLSDGTELPFDLFLGVPKHVAPKVVTESGMTENGWIPADPKNLKTKFDGVYAVGDVSSVGVPKAGVFAEGAAKIAAASILFGLQAGESPSSYTGAGSCYIEYGGGKVGRVDVDFLSGPDVVGKFHMPSEEMVSEKEQFGSSRRARWFGMK
jgi:sulfide:quinone oxidoreductase